MVNKTECRFLMMVAGVWGPFKSIEVQDATSFNVNFKNFLREDPLLLRGGTPPPPTPSDPPTSGLWPSVQSSIVPPTIYFPPLTSSKRLMRTLHLSHIFSLIYLLIFLAFDSTGPSWRWVISNWCLFFHFIRIFVLQKEKIDREMLRWKS